MDDGFAMNIAFDVTHPADVHVFRQLIRFLEAKGHRTIVTVRDHAVSRQLLEHAGIAYHVRKSPTGIWQRLLGIFQITWQIYHFFRQHCPDFLIGGPGNIYIPIVARLLGKRSIIIDDTEHTLFQNFITFRLAHQIYTPSCYLLNIGKKQVHFNGTKELIYLTADVRQQLYAKAVCIKKEYAVDGRKLICIRLSAWQAAHDLFTNSRVNWPYVVSVLDQIANVIIIPAGKIVESLKKWMPAIEPASYHELLAAADIVITEGATSASEAAILGKPVIYCHALRLGYIDDLDKQYNMVTQVHSDTELLFYVKSLLNQNHFQQYFKQKQELYLSEKDNIYNWLVNRIEYELSLLAKTHTDPDNIINLVANMDPEVLRPGGIENYVREIARRLRTEGLGVRLIGVKELGRRQAETGNSVEFKFTEHVPVHVNTSDKFTGSLRFITSLLRNSLFLNRLPAHVLHFQRPDHALAFVFSAKRKVCTIHGQPEELILMTKSRYHAAIYQFLERITLPRMHAIICVSKTAADHYMYRFPNLANRIYVLRPFIANMFHHRDKKVDRHSYRSHYGLSQTDTVITFAGRFEQEKNLRRLVQDIQSLLETDSRLHLLLIGDGSELDEIKKLIRCENVHVKAAVAYSEMPSVYRMSDYTILYSHAEGCPMVALESLACGTPVIARNVGDLQFLIRDGVNGWLIDNGNDREALKEILQRPPLLISDFHLNDSIIEDDRHAFERLLMLYRTPIMPEAASQPLSNRRKEGQVR